MGKTCKPGTIKYGILWLMMLFMALGMLAVLLVLVLLFNRIFPSMY